MSEKTIYYCDACSSELPEKYDPEYDRVRIPVGLESDPAGGASSTDYRNLDLCQSCLVKAVNEFVHRKCSFEYNSEMMSIFASRRKFTLTIPHMDVTNKVSVGGKTK